MKLCMLIFPNLAIRLPFLDFSGWTNTNLIPKRIKRLTASDYDFQQDYTDLFANLEDV